ncbi:MAG: T9SS type A sorting domain-containing protein [Prevotellaceae bacterium]|jgi:hypothetical protein|nr:T9SS type A sorting domain-containing protein [Prevotellaceae bacterium]
MKKIIFLSFVFVAFSISSFGQKIVETQYFKNNPELGGDVVITASSKEVKGEKSYTSFDVTAPVRGSYHLNFWLLPAKLSDGSYSRYEVLVNGLSAGSISPAKGNWQSIGLDKSAKVALKPGANTISIVATAPEIAEVEFVCLSTNVSKAAISSAKYDQFLAKTKSSSNDENVGLRSTTANPGVALDSKANYLFYPNVAFNYTYYKTVNFTAGQQVFIATQSSKLHVVELFNANNPDAYSWVHKSSLAYQIADRTVRTSNFQPSSSQASLSDYQFQFVTGTYLGSINITIPVSGTYYVKVRSAVNGTAGVANVNINGQYYYEDVPIHSTGFRVTQGGDGVAYNTFTTNLTGDARLWLERGTAIPGKTVAWNDDWAQGGLNSRIRLDGDKAAVHGVLLSTYSSSNPTGKCDLYVKCLDGAVYPSFPNLNPLYEIQSAPIDPTYNALSWAAGITEFAYEPTTKFVEYYVENNPLESFHKFLLTPKYDECPVYSKIGATQENSVIDLRMRYDNVGNLYIGASIKDGADNHPHGFAWETKFGQNLRCFHPRTSLEGGYYGNTVAYFRRVGTGKLLAEAIADGTAVLQHVEFTPLEDNIIAAQKAILTTTVKNTFNAKFNAWKATNNYNSAKIINNSEFDSLLSYCISNPGTAYLVYEKLGDSDFDASYLVDTLSLVSLNNVTILDNIIEDSKQMRLRAANNINYVDTIVSPIANAMKYVKAILTGGGAPLLSPGQGNGNSESVATGIRYSNDDEFNAVNNSSGISINFSIRDNAKISLAVIDLKGRVMETVLQGQALSSGNHNYTVNLPAGIYLVKYVLNGNVNVKKVIVK